jgi:hypothetical protein
MGRHSFESGGEAIRGLAQLAHRGEPFSNGPALPVAVGFGVLFLQVGHAANCLIHGYWFLRDDPGPEHPRSQKRNLGHPSGVFTATTAAATLSSGSRLSRRTPWVARPAARTCLVSMRMILPYWPGAPPLSQPHRELVGCYRRSLAYQSRRRPDSTRRHRIVESWAAFCGMLATYRSPLADRTKSWRGFRARPTDAATCLPIYPPHR